MVIIMTLIMIDYDNYDITMMLLLIISTPKS